MTTQKKSRIYYPIQPQPLSPADDRAQHLASASETEVKDVDGGLRIGRP
ncbi:hypothetical protein V1281_001489 [Nitrobacteraceae bacterium AZCC 2161]